MDSMRQSACLVSNTIMGYCYQFFINFAMVGQTTDSSAALLTFKPLVGA